MNNDILIPNLKTMSDQEVRDWVSSLSTSMVYAHYDDLTSAIMERFGPDARVVAATHQQPKIIQMVH